MITNLQEYTVRGLTHEEVERRLAMEGYNELPSSRPRNLFQIALGVLKEPMFILLVVCGSSVSYTHLRAHETVLDLVCRLLLEKKKKQQKKTQKKQF